MALLYILDIVLFVVFFVNIIYLLVFSLASTFRRANLASVYEANHHRMAILIPSYKEDQVIVECANSCLAQKYPKHCYDVVVISDGMSEQTNCALSAMGVKVIEVFFENSTKSKALNHAMAELSEDYDVAIILDADNTVSPDFLSQINCEFEKEGTQIVQAHRSAKNINTGMALLDAVSEEINNSIFRQGHVNLGFSAALIGSGMAFDYMLFKNTMKRIDAIGGFDRALELMLLKEKRKIAYLPDAYVLDEKVQFHDDFSRQRRRWLSAQFHYMCGGMKDIIPAIKVANWDFCDKMFQQMSLPRVLLLGFCVFFAFVLSFVSMQLALKWWALLLLLSVALLLAVPRRLYTAKLFYAMLQLPYSFILMAINMFKLRGANKKFIHTSHGVKKQL